MPVKLKAIALGNPGDPSAPKKYFAQTSSNGELSLRQLAINISDGSTLRTTDVMAAIEGLLQEIHKGLIEGKLIRLGDFGSFGIRIHSGGYDTAEEVTARVVDKVKIIFRPGKVLEIIPRDLQFVRE